MTLKNLTILPPALPVFPLGRDQYIKLAAEWFGLDVANGDAQDDTIKSYMYHLKHWLTWCQVNGVDPGRPTVDHVKAFRREMVKAELSHSTISGKLTVVRTFYDGALQRGLIDHNPAKNVRPPRERGAKEDELLHLETDEANRLFRAISHDDLLKTHRDRAMISLMTIGGLRRVEVVRANVEDLKYKHVREKSGGTRRRLGMLIHGKGKNRHKFIRDDVAAGIEKYLYAREVKGSVAVDNHGEPIFVSLSKAGKPLSRITRDGLSRVLNSYLIAAGLRVKQGPPNAGEKRVRQRSCHALRHTYGAELWREHKDMKIVQEELGHTTLEMAGRYSHVDSKSRDRHADNIPINIDGD